MSNLELYEAPKRSMDEDAVRMTAEEALRRAEDVQPRLNAFSVILGEEARARAGKDPTQGPLGGVPVAVKDLFDVAGTPTTGCCAGVDPEPAERDAAAVEALRAAGAVVVGKTNQHELACGATNAISACGPAWNPWGEGRMTGGSSGGSAAAVAAGVVPLALGSDTGGSVRMPASFCGVTGLKTTSGAISLRGAMPLAPFFDTVGPIARSADDCLIAYRVLAGFDPDDPWSEPGEATEVPGDIEGLRIAIPDPFFAVVHPEVRPAIEDAAGAFSDLRCAVRRASGPSLDETVEAWAPIAWSQMAEHHGRLEADERVHPEVRGLLRQGRSHSGTDVTRALRGVREVRRRFEGAFASADVLLTPATPFPAPPMDAEEVECEGGTLRVHEGGPAFCTLPVNVAGLPAVAFPVGFSSEGMPMGAQLIGPPWSEGLLCRLVSAYQEVTDWHRSVPVSAP